MEVRYRAETSSLLYSCLSGCRRNVSAYTQFSNGWHWLEYCDECARSRPYHGVKMYVELVVGAVTYTIFNTYRVGEIPIYEIVHDFKLSKI